MLGQLAVNSGRVYSKMDCPLDISDVIRILNQHQMKTVDAEKQRVTRPTSAVGKSVFANHQGSLDPKKQFWWGYLGGCIILGFKVWSYANTLAPNASCPNASFKTCLLCVLGFAFPIVSGFISRVCDPNHPLIAVFEGTSVPVLFLLIAKDFPF